MPSLFFPTGYRAIDLNTEFHLIVDLGEILFIHLMQKIVFCFELFQDLTLLPWLGTFFHLAHLVRHILAQITHILYLKFLFFT
jgi:hypothetical protein